MKRPFDLGVVPVQIGLMAEKTVPVVRPGDRVPGPVRVLGIGKDNPHVFIFFGGVAPDVPVAFFGTRLPRLLKPGVLIRGVVENHLGHDAHPARVRLV